MINERDNYYHATDLEGFKGILEEGEIKSHGSSMSFEEDAPKNLQDKWQQLTDAGKHEEAGDVVRDWNDDTSKWKQKTGVSVSRTPRVASKADKAITFVIDRKSMPKSRPYVESGYEKTNTPYYTFKETMSKIGASQEETDHAFNLISKASKLMWEEKGSEAHLKAARDSVEYENSLYKKYGKPHTKLNKQFEFENRTYNQPISLKSVKEIIVDKGALFEKYLDQLKTDKWGKGKETVDSILSTNSKNLEEIQKLAAEKGIKVTIKESGRDVHTSRVVKSPKQIKEDKINESNQSKEAEKTQNAQPSDINKGQSEEEDLSQNAQDPQIDDADNKAVQKAIERNKKKSGYGLGTKQTNKKKQ